MAGEEVVVVEAEAEEETRVEAVTAPTNAEAAEDGTVGETAPLTKKHAGTVRDAVITAARLNALQAGEGTRNPGSQEDHHPTNRGEEANPRTRPCGRTRTAVTRK